MSVDGIRNNRSPEKPTTSASTRWPLGVSTKQLLPTGSLSPTASITSPATRVSRPLTVNGWLARTAVLESSKYFCQRLRRLIYCATAPGTAEAQRRRGPQRSTQ